jgi:Ni/Fe-hydrogenase subunit HybB-like protein
MMSEEGVAVAKQGEHSWLNPFNVVMGLILLAGLVITFRRFTGGLGSVTNLDDTSPWGIWVGFDLYCGVALAAGGYVTAAAVELFGLKKYHAAVRPAILTGFLGYSLVGFALLYDVGRPWRLPYPFFVSQGVTSVMFEVGACVLLYLTVLFLEFSPIALEWLGLKQLRNLLVKLTLALTVLGVVLSTLHQSSLGAMMLIAPSKLHPLWYSPFMPIFFFISSIVAGLSMVIFEATLSHRYFADKMDQEHAASRDAVALGFGKAASMVLAGYFAIKVFGVALGNHWDLLFTGWGAWFLVEMLGFVALPGFLFAVGVRDRNVKLIRGTALLSVLGIVLNRFNVTLIAFNWTLPLGERYIPNIQEIGVSVFVIGCGLLAFRFIVTRMPVFYQHPDYHEAH